MAGRAMQRARRTTRAVSEGSRILAYLREDATRAKLVAAAETGYPPVGAVSAELAALVGETVLRPHTAKQFIGLCVRAILEEEGFAVDRAGVRLPHDPVFQTGAVYRKVEPTNAVKEHDLLARFLDSLTRQEVDFVLKYLNARGHGSI